MVCDNLVSLLPNWPDNSATRVKDTGILVLDRQKEPGEEYTEYTLDDRELLRLVLREWGRPNQLSFCVPKDME